MANSRKPNEQKNPMDEHLSFEMAEAFSKTWDPNQPSDADLYRKMAGPPIHILEKILKILKKADSEATSTKKLLEQEGMSEYPTNLVRNYWYQFANTVHKLEQLMWTYCDESWFGRSRMTEGFLERENVNETLFQIKLLPDMILIKMPYIPATRKTRFTMVEDMLWSYLKSCKDLPEWDECHATFSHVYPKSVRCMPKDVDNYAYKRTIDTLSTFLRFSDSATTFSMSTQTIFTNKLSPGTYIILEPKSQKKFENLLETLFPISDPKIENMEKSQKK